MLRSAIKRFNKPPPRANQQNFSKEEGKKAYKRNTVELNQKSIILKDFAANYDKKIPITPSVPSAVYKYLNETYPEEQVLNPTARKVNNAMRFRRHQIREIIDDSPLLQKMGEKLEFDWEKQLMVTLVAPEMRRIGTKYEAFSLSSQVTYSGKREIYMFTDLFKNLGRPVKLFYKIPMMVAPFLAQDKPILKVQEQQLKHYSEKPEKIIEELLIHEMVNIYDQQINQRENLKQDFRTFALAECRAHTFTGSSKSMNLNYIENVLRIYLGMLRSIYGSDRSKLNPKQTAMFVEKFKMDPAAANSSILHSMVRNFDYMSDYRHVADLIEDFGDEHLPKYEIDDNDRTQLDETIAKYLTKI